MNDERPPEAIQWHEGMLLAPQHFQQFALRSDILLNYHLRCVNPNHYGVRQLRLDPAQLVAGVVRVLELEAIMPDGLVVFYPNGGDDLSLALEPYQAELERGPLKIHLALPSRRVEGASGSELARYDSVEGASVVDLNTGDGELRIPRLRPRLRLIAGEVPPQKFVSFPLCEVRYRDESFSLTSFIPPLLAVTAESELGSACAVIARRLREKAVLLAERARSPAAHADEPMTLGTQATIRSLVAALPELEALIASGQAHPFQLYIALCRLAGELSTLGPGQVPPVLGAYRHNAIRASFDPLLDFIMRRIDDVQLAYREVAFEIDNGGFRLQLRPSWYRPRLVIGARRRPGATESDLLAWMERCLIGSEDRILMLTERRLLGAKRQRIERDDELGVIPGERMMLFAIDANPDIVRPDAPLFIINRFDPKLESGPLELVLYVSSRLATVHPLR